MASTVTGEIATCITAALALVVVYNNVRSSVRNKQADLLIYFNKQFDELQKKRAELLIMQATSDTSQASAKRMDIEARFFFDRFWSLQFDQYVAWYEGHMPTRLFVYWVFARWRELSQPSIEGRDPLWTLGGKTMASSLEEVKTRWSKSPDKDSRHSHHVNAFFELMEQIAPGTEDNADGSRNTVDLDIEKLLQANGPSAWIQRRRKLFGAY